MARTGPLTRAAIASLGLHALGLLAIAALLKESAGRGYSRPVAIVARLVETEVPPREAPKPLRLPRKPVAPIERAAPLPPPPPADGTTVAQFRQQFISSAARYLDYPHAALANEAEGEVVVSVSISAGRAGVDVSLKKSSGHVLLDQQAMDMFRRAAAQLPVPSTLRGQEFAFEVPVVYALKR
jgi:protein TonB